jgi:hypothetical protein
MHQHNEGLKRALELHKRSRADFSKAHRNGVAALACRDYAALTIAVREEASAIAAHRVAFQQLNQTIKSRAK